MRQKLNQNQKQIFVHRLEHARNVKELTNLEHDFSAFDIPENLSEKIAFKKGALTAIGQSSSLKKLEGIRHKIGNEDYGLLLAVGYKQLQLHDIDLEKISDYDALKSIGEGLTGEFDDLALLAIRDRQFEILSHKYQQVVDELRNPPEDEAEIMSLPDKDKLVQDLRDFEMRYEAEKVLLSMYGINTEQALSVKPRGDSGWPIYSKKVFESPLGGYTPKSKPDFDIIAVPKFRGIHYTPDQDPTSYKRHEDFLEDHQKLPVYSPAARALISENQGPRFKPSKIPQDEITQEYRDSARRINKKLNKMFGKRDGYKKQNFVKPPLVEDYLQQRIARTHEEESQPFQGKTRKGQEDQSQFDYDQQFYVNSLGEYQSGLKKRSPNFPHMTQVSTTDSAFHASQYAIGNKFTTKEEAGAKKKNTQKRKIQGTVGHVETYLASPLAYHKPSLDHDDQLVGMIPKMQADKRVKIKSRILNESETTYYSSIPGEHIAKKRKKRVIMDDTDSSEEQPTHADLRLTTPVVIPTEQQASYAKNSNKPAGKKMREKFAELSGASVVRDAQQAASSHGKVLVSHGELYTKLLQPDPTLIQQSLQVKKEAQQRALDDLVAKRAARAKKEVSFDPKHFGDGTSQIQSADGQDQDEILEYEDTTMDHF